MTYTIFWDWDGTVVNETSLRWTKKTKDPIPKPGIEQLLADLSQNDFQHVVTTGNLKDFVEEDARAAGLNYFFRQIFGRETVSTKRYENGETFPIRRGKLYAPVLANLGLSPEQAPSNSIIIGNSMGDIPLDVENLVFIYEEKGDFASALDLQVVLTALLKAGKGDFYAGFMGLYHQAASPECKFSFGCDAKNIKFLNLGELFVELGYIDSQEQSGMTADKGISGKVPTIYLNMRR